MGRTFCTRSYHVFLMIFVLLFYDFIEKLLVMRWFLRITILMCAVIILLVVLIPSFWVIKKFTTDILPIQYSSIHGYWWAGRVKKSSLVLRGYRVSLGDISWKYDWNSFLSTQACFFIFAQSYDVQGSGQFCYPFLDDTSQINDFHFTIDAAEFSEVTGVSIDGFFEGHLQEVKITSSLVTFVKGNAFWKNAAFYNGGAWIDFKEWQLTINTSPEAMKKSTNMILVQVVDVNSLVEIDVIASFQDGKVKSISGYAQPRFSNDKNLMETLIFLSQKKQGERFIFDQNF